MLGRAKILGTLLMVLSVAGCGDMWGDLWGSKRNAVGPGDGGSCTADQSVLTQIILNPPTCDAGHGCPCGSYCNSTTTGVCVVDCRNDSECALGKTCSSWGQCIGGTSDAGVPPNPSCPRNSALLTEIKQQPRLCDFDDVCPYGSRCDTPSQRCVADCSSDSDCVGDGPLVCSCLGKCVPPAAVPETPKSRLPRLELTPSHIALGKLTGAAPQNPTWDGVTRRQITLSVVADVLVDGQAPPPITITPGPNTVVNFYGQTDTNDVVTVTPHDFAKVGDVYRASIVVEIAPTPTVDGAPAATGWSVRFGSDAVVASPQVVDVSYSDVAQTPVVLDNWVDVGSLAQDFSARGTATITTSTGSRLVLPVSARADSIHILDIDDESKTLSPSGKLAWRPGGALSPSDTTEDWISLGPTDQTNRGTGISSIKLVPYWLQKNQATGAVAGAFALQFTSVGAPSGVGSYSSATGVVTVPVTVDLYPVPASQNNLCGENDYCNAGYTCDMGFCSQGRATKVTDTNGLGTSSTSLLHANLWPGALTSDDVTDYTVACAGSVWGDEAMLSNFIGAATGDAMCTVSAAGAGGGGVVAQFPSLVVPLLVHKDLEDAGLRKSKGAADLLSECFKDLNRPNPLPGQTTVQSAYPPGFVDYPAECINIGLYMTTVLKARQRYALHPVKDSSIPDSGSSFFLHLLEQWVDLHSFIARQAVDQRELADVLTTDAPSTPASSVPLVSVLDELETGWAFLFEHLSLSSDLFSISPDYRQPLLASSFCTADSKCGTAETCDDSRCVVHSFDDLPQHEQPIGIATKIIEGLTGHLHVVGAVVDDATAKAYGNSAAGGLVVQAIDRYGIAMRFALQAEAYASAIHDHYAQCGSTCLGVAAEARWTAAIEEFKTVRESLMDRLAGLKAMPFG